MKAVITRYYDNKQAAVAYAKKMKRLWLGRLAWYVVCASNGYFVISETAARKCYPSLFLSYKNRRYGAVQNVS